MLPNKGRKSPKQPANGDMTLATYMNISTYVPSIGDFIIWTGWFRTWYGIVSGVSSSGDVMSIIWEGIPMLLFTLTSQEQLAATKEVPVSKITSAINGTFSVLKYDAQHNATIWYI